MTRFPAIKETCRETINFLGLGVRNSSNGSIFSVVCCVISLNSCAGKTTAFAGKLKSATCIFGLRLGLIVNQRSRNQQRRVTDDACKEASTRLFQRFTTLTNRVEEKNNGSLRPDELLPVDVFLDEMVRRHPSKCYPRDLTRLAPASRGGTRGN